MRKVFIVVLMLLSGILGFSLSWYLHKNNNTVFEVQTIETYHQPLSFVNQLKNDPDAGKKIFKEFCASCHAVQPVIDVNAPRIGDKKAWKIRRKLNFPTLLKMTIDGVGAMPARGGCFECSDEDLEKAIQYMLKN